MASAASVAMLRSLRSVQLPQFRRFIGFREHLEVLYQHTRASADINYP